MYLAFSVSHLNGAEPSIDSLNEFERKELTHQKKSAGESKGRVLHDSSSFDQFNASEMEDADELMEAYISKAPKVSAPLMPSSIVY